MTNHLTFPTVSADADDPSVAAAQAAPDQIRTGDGEARLSFAGQSQPRLTHTSPVVWKHRLVLTGKLDCRSAAELEDEVECLCQEGVTNLTLDLGQLEAIDATGATAIVFCGVAFRQRGRELAVIPGSRATERALIEAGAEDLLVDEPSVGVLHSRRTPHSDPRDAERSTSTINKL